MEAAAMTELLVELLLWSSAIGCGLLAGVYLAFSTFIMTALGRIEQAHGISAMNSINSTILQSLFMPLFAGTTLAGLALAVLGLARWPAPGSAAMLAGGSVYVLGMFICTLAFNVPLNNLLAALDRAGSLDAASVWTRYLRNWTAWNHVRTIASTAASALYIAAIAAR
jgi:uncharacterized membrane protein